MSIGTLLAIVIALLVIWYWQNTMRARETALMLCKTLCKDHQLQLLDETVTLQKTRLKRNANGRVGLYRLYTFDYTLDDNSRHTGEISILDNALCEQHFFSHQRTTLLNSESTFPASPTAKILTFRPPDAHNDEKLDL